MTAPAPPHHDPNYARLDQRVTGLEDTLGGIKTTLQLLGEKLDKRSQPQWIVMLSAGALVVTILGLVLAGWKAPLDSTIQRQEYDLRRLQEGVVPRIEHEGQWSQSQRERDEMMRRLDRLEDKAFP